MGDELALGQKLDTNSRWLAQRLTELGAVPVEHLTVPDDLERTTQAFARLAASVDLVVTTGGLGPTADDLTRQGLAAAMGDELVEDADALEQITRWFAGRGRGMPEMNRVQALRPSRARLIPNPNGTAPGISARMGGDSDGCDVFCLPGPPGEMMPMFDQSVASALRIAPDRAVSVRVFQTVGLGESDVAARLGDLMDRGRNPLVGTTASGGVISIRVRYEGARADAEREIDRTAALVKHRVGDIFFGEGEVSIAEAVVHELKRQVRRLAVVESCTGGMLGSMVGDVAGASDVFEGGWITYSNGMKNREVNVPASLIAEHGAVSGQVSAAMADGGRKASGVDYCLAVTGVAGPGGGTAEKPIGTVWVALSTGGGTDVRRFKMAGDRSAVREWSARSALAMLWFHLSGRPGTSLLRQVEQRSGGDA